MKKIYIQPELQNSTICTFNIMAASLEGSDLPGGPGEGTHDPNPGEGDDWGNTKKRDDWSDGLW